MANKIRITTIGGGTGSPTIIKSLVLAGFSDISAISAAMDSGGKTGQLRTDERDRVIAISDLLRNLLALISPRQNHLDQVSAFTDLVGFTDGRNRNLGYTIYYALLEKYAQDFLQVQNLIEKMLGIKFHGQAIPITLESANINFTTRSGVQFVGEHELDRQSMSTNTIKKIFLDHPVKATSQALSAIKKSDYLIYSPGSIYGSILSNFLPTGTTAALKNSHAQKIIITNLVSNRNQTHQFTPLSYLRLFQDYTGLRKPFSVFICPNITMDQFNRLHPRIAATYASEHSHFLGWTDAQLAPLQKNGIQIIKADVFSITPQLNRIRHDPQKLARVLKEVII